MKTPTKEITPAEKIIDTLAKLERQADNQNLSYNQSSEAIALLEDAYEQKLLDLSAKRVAIDLADHIYHNQYLESGEPCSFNTQRAKLRVGAALIACRLLSDGDYVELHYDSGVRLRTFTRALRTGSLMLPPSYLPQIEELSERKTLSAEHKENLKGCLQAFKETRGKTRKLTPTARALGRLQELIHAQSQQSATDQTGIN